MYVLFSEDHSWISASNSVEAILTLIRREDLVKNLAIHRRQKPQCATNRFPIFTAQVQDDAPPFRPMLHLSHPRSLQRPDIIRQTTTAPTVKLAQIIRSIASNGTPVATGGIKDSRISFHLFNQFRHKTDFLVSLSSRHIKRSLGSGGGDASSVLSSGGRTQKSSGSSKLSHGATARDSGGSSGHCTHRSEPPPRIQVSIGSKRLKKPKLSHQVFRIHSFIRSRTVGATFAETAVLRRNIPRRKIGREKAATEAALRDLWSYRTRKIQRAATARPNSVQPVTQGGDKFPGIFLILEQFFHNVFVNRFSDSWKEDRGRPILRSKSDISDRYWRHDNIRSTKSAHPARSVAQLEIFFDRLGLDSDNYHRITEPDSKSSSPVFFDSVSSVDSALGLYSWAGNNQANQWKNNNCSIGRVGTEDCTQRPSDPPSIVERNARIIKWLCQCRKVQFGYS